MAKQGALQQEFLQKNIALVYPWVTGKNKNPFYRLFWLFVLVIQVHLYLLFRRPRIVHFFLPESYLIAGPIAVLMGIRTRIMSRRSLNNYQRKFPSFVRKFELWLHRHMHAILGNSEKVIQQLIVEENVPQDKCHLIYNGIDVTPREHVPSRLPMQIPRTSVRLSIVANLLAYKGHMDLMKALTLMDVEEDWHLLVIGQEDGDLKASLTEYVTSAGLGHRVHFMGSRDNVRDLLEHVDIGLLVSHEEGFSNALLEGMAASLPMVVTDVGGNAEAVIDGETGLVVPPKRPDQIAKALETLLSNSERAKRMGASARQRVVSHFSIQQSVQKYEQLYLSFVDAGN